MNEYLQSAILGAIQGIAEFLPISSSGHLVLAKHVLRGLSGGSTLSQGKELEVLLHIGTLASILVVYFDDLRKQIWNLHLWAQVVLASIPAAIVGLTFDEWFDQAFESVTLVGLGLIVTAGFLWSGYRFESARWDLQSLPWVSAFVIGCFQALALVPGISRSGSTISGALLTGVDRVSATRFSFLMAIPVTAGAIALTLKRAVEQGGFTVAIGPAVFGTAMSFAVGWVSLKLLIQLISQRKLHWFAGYCLALGLTTLAASLVLQNDSDRQATVALVAGARVAVAARNTDQISTARPRMLGVRHSHHSSPSRLNAP